MTHKTNKTIIYARLSIEDGLDDISSSIQNQISICKDYANEHDLLIDEIYFDDGYSGTNFDRPEFQRLIKNIEENKVTTVIVKDLSRIGRNFIKTSFYIEDFFVKHRIRFISVNDNYDSETNKEDLSLPIRNYLNGLYAKECQKKRKVYLDTAKHKKSFAIDGIYGYRIIDNQFVIDEVASQAVKLIFSMYLKGYKNKEIINKLIEERYTCPSYHKQFEIESKFTYKADINNPYYWTKETIYRILNERQYTGDAVNIKSLAHIKGFKRIRNKNPTIILNHHPPIISKEDFEKVQKKFLSNRHSTKVNDSIRLKGMFIDEDGKTYVYRCVRHKGKEPCGKRYISSDLKHRFDADLAHEILYTDSLRLFELLNNNYPKFKEQYLADFKKDDSTKNVKLLNKEKNDLTIKIKELFEKYTFEEISEEEYKMQNSKIKTRLEEIEKYLSEMIISQSLQIDAMKRLDKFVLYLNEINISEMDKLDFIRAMISKVVVVKNADNKLTFKITYRYELDQ